jgi:VanZ family protein
MASPAVDNRSMTSTLPGSSWRARSSPLARSAFAVYALLLLYAGLAPWSGWRDLGVHPLAFLSAPVPRHVTTFDLLVNVLGYLPLGALVVLAGHPRLRGPWGPVAALAVGALLSGTVEALQTYLPARIASNLDLATNTAGALLGGLLIAPFSSSLIDRGRLADIRLRWFERRPSLLLLVVALWPIAQIHPGPMLFGNGNVRDSVGPWLTAFGGRWPTLNEIAFGPAEFVLAEAFVVAAAMLAVGLALASAMRPTAPRSRLLLALLAAALATRTFAQGVQFGPERALAWLTPGAYGGLAIGLLALLAASGGAPSWRPRYAMLVLVLMLVAVNLVPDNPYYSATLVEWRHGALTHFNALAHWLSLLWPYALAVILPVHAVRARELH